MKKLGLALIAVLILTGCSQKQEITTFMVTNDKKISALYNNEGEQLTEYNYKTSQEIEKFGYIVTNNKDQVGFINNQGELKIPFGEYQTLRATDKMLYATKKVEKEGKVENNIDYENLFILNGEGEVLYTASKNLGIRRLPDSNMNKQDINQSALPIIIKDKQYKVLYQDGQEFVSGEEEIVSAHQVDHGKCIIVNYKDHSAFYDFANDEKGQLTEIDNIGNYAIVAVDPLEDKSAILYDKTTQSLIGVNREEQKAFYEKIAINQVRYDDINNILLTQGNKTYLYVLGNKPTEITSYYKNGTNYLTRASQVYGPHQIHGKQTGVKELNDCQLYPTPYLIMKDIYPVYMKKKGYMYYNFAGESVIKDVYLEAEPFDINGVAIVKKDEKGYSLIDESGNVKTTNQYAQIKAIGSVYYAVYNENGSYGIVDEGGKEVLPIEYTTLPRSAYILYQNREYLLLNKNGRSYLYDVKEDLEEVMSIEGALEFNEKGYFTDGSVYYTFDGERIN